MLSLHKALVVPQTITKSSRSLRTATSCHKRNPCLRPIAGQQVPGHWSPLCGSFLLFCQVHLTTVPTATAVDSACGHLFPTASRRRALLNHWAKTLNCAQLISARANFVASKLRAQASLFGEPKKANTFFFFEGNTKKPVGLPWPEAATAISVSEMFTSSAGQGLSKFALKTRAPNKLPASPALVRHTSQVHFGLNAQKQCRPTTVTSAL